MTTLVNIRLVDGRASHSTNGCWKETLVGLIQPSTVRPLPVPTSSCEDNTVVRPLLSAPITTWMGYGT